MKKVSHRYDPDYVSNVKADNSLLSDEQFERVVDVVKRSRVAIEQFIKDGYGHNAALEKSQLIPAVISICDESQAEHPNTQRCALCGAEGTLSSLCWKCKSILSSSIQIRHFDPEQPNATFAMKRCAVCGTIESMLREEQLCASCKTKADKLFLNSPEYIKYIQDNSQSANGKPLNDADRNVIYPRPDAMNLLSFEDYGLPFISKKINHLAEHKVRASTRHYRYKTKKVVLVERLSKRGAFSIGIRQDNSQSKPKWNVATPKGFYERSKANLVPESEYSFVIGEYDNDWLMDNWSSVWQQLSTILKSHRAAYESLNRLKQ